MNLWITYFARGGYSCETSRPVSQSEFAYVELKHKLKTDGFNHSFINLKWIVCWGSDKSVVPDAEFKSAVDETDVRSEVRDRGPLRFLDLDIRAIGFFHKTKQFVAERGRNVLRSIRALNGLCEKQLPIFAALANQELLACSRYAAATLDQRLSSHLAFASETDRA